MLFSRLSVNSIWLFLSRLATQVGMAWFTILLARQLGSAGFGEYAFMASVIVIGNILTTFGTDMFLIREIAAGENLSRLFPALLIQLLLSAAFIGLVFASSFGLSSQGTQAASALRIYALSMIPLAFYTISTTALRGRQRMLEYAVLNLLVVILQLLAAFWLKANGGGLISLARLLLGVQIAAALISGVFCTILFSDFWRGWRPSTGGMLELAKSSAAIALLGMLGILYQRISLILLPLITSADATGWFSAAAKLIEAAKIGHLAVLTALYPMMSQARATGSANWTKFLRIPWILLVGAASLGSAIIYFCATPLVALLFGSAYLPSVPVIQILAWLLIPFTLNNFLSLALLTRGDESAIATALAGSLALLVVLTLWWTPAEGAVGAAWAALVAEFSQFLLLFVEDRRRGRIMEAMLRAPVAR